MSEWLREGEGEGERSGLSFASVDQSYLSIRTVERLSICSDIDADTDNSLLALPDGINGGVDNALEEGIFSHEEAAALKRCWVELTAVRNLDMKLFAQQFHLSMLDTFLTDAYRVEELFIRTMKSYAELGELVLREEMHGRRRSMLGDGDDCDVSTAEQMRSLKEQKRLFRLQLQELEDGFTREAVAAVPSLPPVQLKQGSIHSLASSSSSHSKDTTASKSNNRRDSVSGAISKRALSSAWAGHLQQVQPAKGVLRPAGSGSSPLQVKLKWPEWLVDEQFDVVKVNLYGKKYDRTLKLTGETL